MGKLSAAKIRALKEPGRYSDGDGLILTLKAPKVGNWTLRATINGRRRDIGLGALSLVTLAEAREAAFEMRRDISRGLDPILERKRKQLVIPTFEEAARSVFEEQREGWKNAKHIWQWMATLERHVFPVIGDRLVNDIEGPIIREVLSPIWLEIPDTARRIKQRIGVVLDWAYANGLRATEAPIRSIARGLPKQPTRDNHYAAMAYDHIPVFLQELRRRSSAARLALEFVVLTATRSGEVRGAKWDEVDTKNRLWTIPKDRMKMGKAHGVPLNSVTLGLLERAKPFHAPCSNLIFPGRNVMKPLSDMTLIKILRDNELPFTVHGFRSSFRDWVAEQTNHPGEVAEAALAHSVANKVEAAYRRTDYLEKRRVLMDEWSSYCLRAELK